MNSEQIIRAWKNEDYRLSLNEAELSALPAHPAGLVELADDDLTRVAGNEEITSLICIRTIQWSIAITAEIVTVVASCHACPAPKPDGGGTTH